MFFPGYTNGSVTTSEMPQWCEPWDAPMPAGRYVSVYRQQNLLHHGQAVVSGSQYFLPSFLASHSSERGRSQCPRASAGVINIKPDSDDDKGADYGSANHFRRTRNQ